MTNLKHNLMRIPQIMEPSHKGYSPSTKSNKHGTITHPFAPIETASEVVDVSEIVFYLAMQTVRRLNDLTLAVTNARRVKSCDPCISFTQKETHIVAID